MTPAMRLGLLSALFPAVAFAVLAMQRRAATCPRHRREAGFAARSLAAGCLAAGLVPAVWAAIAQGRIEP